MSLFDQFNKQIMARQLASMFMESLLNKLLKDTKNSDIYLRKLNEHVLVFCLQKPRINFYLSFSAQKIDILTDYSGETNCRVDVSEDILQHLNQDLEVTKLINDKAVVITGDMKVLQNFASLWAYLDKSPSVMLAPIIGDIAAYNLVKLFINLAKTLQQKIIDNREGLSENITEEWLLSPHPLAVADFEKQVMELSSKTDDLLMKTGKLLS